MVSSHVDWSDWVRRWDAQQSLYMQDRERRFAAMFDALEASGPVTRVLDLASGPGSLSQRLLARFPRARAVLVDFDPVLLQVARGALSSLAHRIAWVETDLRRPAWTRAIPAGPYDAVLSTTALHWLTATQLARVYAALPELLRPGGLFLNGDRAPYERDEPTLRSLAEHVSASRRAQRGAAWPVETWDEWWSGLAREPSLRATFAERRRRFPREHHGERPLPFSRHAALLEAAGMIEVGTVYQEFDDRVIIAVRPPGAARRPSGSRPATRVGRTVRPSRRRR